MNDLKLKKEITKHLGQALNHCTKFCDDPSYVLYIFICICSEFLIQESGYELFEKTVLEIRTKHETDIN